MMQNWKEYPNSAHITPRQPRPPPPPPFFGRNKYEFRFECKESISTLWIESFCVSAVYVIANAERYHDT